MVAGGLKRDFEVGSEDKNDIMFCEQRVKWSSKGQAGAHITVGQELKVEDLIEAELPADYKHLKNLELVFVAGTDLHSAYNSLLGKSVGFKTVLATTQPMISRGVPVLRLVQA